MAPTGPSKPNDDLLTGFEAEGSRSSELRGFLATTMVGSLYVFDTTFRYGAYHAVYYSQLQHVAVLCLAVLIGIAFIRRQIRVQPWVLVLLVPPVLVFGFRLATPTKDGIGAADVVEDGLTIANALVAPVILWIIARLLAPGLFALPNRRQKVAVAATLTIVAAIGYATGTFNYRTLTCQDFITAGDKAPANCSHSSTP